MSKGNRKRAAPKKTDAKTKSTKVKKKSKDLTKIFPDKDLLKQFPIHPMNTNDSNRIKEIFSLSNTVAGLQKKYVDTNLQIKFSKKFIKQLKDGEIKGPLMIRVSPTLFMPMTDMIKAITSIKYEISMLEEANKLTKTQLEHRYEEYVDAIIRYNRILTNKVGSKKVTTLSVHRTAGGKSTEDEEVIFEKEFEEMAKDDTKSMQEQVNKAIAEDKAKKGKLVTPNKSPIETASDALKKKD